LPWGPPPSEMTSTEAEPKVKIERENAVILLTVPQNQFFRMPSNGKISDGCRCRRDPPRA
jgi:hypothetical protein